MIELVSWYTQDTSYEQVFKDYFLASCKENDLQCNLYIVEPTGNWQKNTNLKPNVAKRALTDLKADILLIDADAKIYSHPQLLEDLPQEYDMAVFYLDWGSWYGHSHGKKELCSGTLFFRNRPVCLDVINAWDELAKENKYPDQRLLEMVLKNFSNVNVYELPIEYCWINSTPGWKPPIVPRPEHVVIEHFQASRKLRNKRGN